MGAGVSVKSEYMRQWRLKNLDRARAIERASKERNKEKVLARKAEYRKRCADKIRAYNAAYQEKNPRLMLEARKKWAARNPHVYNDSRARRRALEVTAMPVWADREAIRRIYEQRVEITKATGIEHHVDHVVPLRGKTVCGLHVHYNLIVIPAAQNCRKSNKWGP
jgi:hypothetical protein